MQPASGRESSEWTKAQRAELGGFSLIVLGVALAVLGALLERHLPAGTGVLLAAVGAYLVAHTSAAYARSRGEVKAASVRPPTRLPGRSL